MSGLEQAIRNALARAESNNPETRARIYQSARNALEAGLRKQEVNDPETIAAQRHRLEMTIRQIETEQRAAAKTPLPEQVPVAAPDRPVAAPGQPATVPGAERVEPEVRQESRSPAAPRQSAQDAEPQLGDIRPDRGEGFGPASRTSAKADTRSRSASLEGAEGMVAASPRMAKAPKRRGRLFSFLLVVATLIAAVGTAAWWVQTSGLLLPQSARDGSVANPKQTVTGDDFSASDPLKEALDTHNSFSSEWREVLSPSDASVLSAGAKGRFEAVSTDEGPAIRVVSSAPDRDGSVAIAVSPAVLQAMAGKTSTVALTVESENGKPAQLAVECDFGTMGDCERHRFTVSERTDLLFQVKFEASLSPSEAGRIFVNSDVTGGGAGVNLYAVRILPGE